MLSQTAMISQPASSCDPPSPSVSVPFIFTASSINSSMVVGTARLYFSKMSFLCSTRSMCAVSQSMASAKSGHPHCLWTGTGMLISSPICAHDNLWKTAERQGHKLHSHSRNTACSFMHDGEDTGEWKRLVAEQREQYTTASCASAGRMTRAVHESGHQHSRATLTKRRGGPQ